MASSDLLLTGSCNQLVLIESKLFSLCVHHPPTPQPLQLWSHFWCPSGKINTGNSPCWISFPLMWGGKNESSSPSHEEYLKEQTQGPTTVNVHLQSSQRGQNTPADTWALKPTWNSPRWLKGTVRIYTAVLNLSFRSVRPGWGVQTSWSVDSVFPNRLFSGWWAPRPPGCPRATEQKWSLWRRSMPLSHWCKRKYKAELLHEELDSSVSDFIQCIIKNVVFFSSTLLLCLRSIFIHMWWCWGFSWSCGRAVLYCGLLNVGAEGSMHLQMLVKNSDLKEHNPLIPRVAQIIKAIFSIFWPSKSNPFSGKLTEFPTLVVT